MSLGGATGCGGAGLVGGVSCTEMRCESHDGGRKRIQIEWNLVYLCG